MNLISESRLFLPISCDHFVFSIKKLCFALSLTDSKELFRRACTGTCDKLLGYPWDGLLSHLQGVAILVIRPVSFGIVCAFYGDHAISVRDALDKMSRKNQINQSCKATFTHHWITFVRGRKLYRIGLLFTHENGNFGAISVTERSCTAPILRVKDHLSDKWCSYFTG